MTLGVSLIIQLFEKICVFFFFIAGSFNDLIVKWKLIWSFIIITRNEPIKFWSHVTCFICTRETTREKFNGMCQWFCVSLLICNLHVDLCGKLDVDSSSEWKFDKIIDLSFNPQLCKFTCNQCHNATTCWSYHRSISQNRPLDASSITCSIKAWIICYILILCVRNDMCAEYMSKKHNNFPFLLVNVAINISSFNAY